MNRFDAQAATYDGRAGLPHDAAPRIAAAVVDLARLQGDDMLLELGTGTGQLAACFAALGVRYTGLDSSRAMLDVAAQRIGATSGAVTLIAADVDAAWPLASGSVRAVFSSRAAHLFDADHVVRETLRVARPPNAVFLLGRVQREARGMRSVLRREMRSQLRARGFVPPDGERGQRRVLDAFRARGATPLGPLVAARWTVDATPASVLAGWRAKPGLGGCDVPDAVKSEILADLARWAASPPDAGQPSGASEECYVVEGIVL